MYLVRLLHGLVLEVHKVGRGPGGSEHRKLRDRFLGLILASLVVDFIGTGLIFGFEHGKSSDDRLSSPFKAFFWVTTQLTTISSQLPTPTTTWGRITDIFLQLWALVVVTALAGSFAAFLQKK